MNNFATSVRLRWLAMLLLGVSFVGCGGKETVGVTGKVTFDGVPVEKGEVSFIPTDGQGGPAGGVIENGAFAFEATPGSKRVEIRASRALPPERQTNPDMGLMYEDYIPAQFNRESTLTAEVKTGGEPTYEFNLTSQP
jgi:hypothetical protein